MSETAQSIEQLEQNPPTPDDGDGANHPDDASSGPRLPRPSRRTMLVLAVVVVVAVGLWWLTRQTDDGPAGAEEMQRAVEDDEDVTAEAGEIEVPHEQGKPLKGDEAVLAALKDSGHIDGADR